MSTRSTTRWCSGRCCARGGLDLEDGLQVYAFQALRQQLSAAQRLGKIGQSAMQDLLHRLKPAVCVERREVVRGDVVTRLAGLRRGWTWRAWPTSTSLLGCFAHEAGQHWHWRAGRLGQDRAGRRAVPRAERTAEHGGHHQRHFHARGCGVPDSRRVAAGRAHRRRRDRARARTRRCATTSRST